MVAMNVISTRRRRTQAEMDDIRTGIIDIVTSDAPMTVRQVFYRCVVAGLVEKTEQEYQGTVARLLLELRRDGEIDYEDIVDGTRLMRKPTSYTGLNDFIERHQRAYRRDLWQSSPFYVEVWCEKDALSGVLYDITWEYDVPLMVSRGFSSESFLHTSAKQMIAAIEDKKEPIVFYFGDYDPSGLKISRSIEAGLRRFLAEEDEDYSDLLLFERVAVNKEQIEEMSLPTRPTKLGSTHAMDWDGGDSVELDAIPPDELRNMVRDSIFIFVDTDELNKLRKIEDEERKQLMTISDVFRSH
jgi:hypothetical protein